MSDEHFKEPKDRILEAAASLFAQKGFSAVGVREIARDANVNISMISYYFNGKLGVLKAIIENYFRDLDVIINDVKALSLPREEKFRVMIRYMVNLIKSKMDNCKVAILELPYDVPEIADFKIKMVRQHIIMLRESFHGGMPMMDDPDQTGIIGPALISLIFSNFLLGHIAEPAFGVKMDDAFYDKYANMISTLYLSGIMGIAAENKKSRGGSHPAGA